MQVTLETLHLVRPGMILRTNSKSLGGPNRICTVTSVHHESNPKNSIIRTFVTNTQATVNLYFHKFDFVSDPNPYTVDQWSID